MNITNEQFKAAEQGKPVEIEADNKKFVLISRDVYDKLTALRYDELAPQETYPAVLEAWDSVGSPDDATDYL